MKILKIILPVILVGLIGVSWFSLTKKAISTYSGYNECIKEAEQSFENGLYEQAIELYKEALKYECKESIYKKIKEVYEVLYTEEPIAYFRNMFIQDMQHASNDFPKNAEFWTRQAELYLEAKNYSKAYATVNKAVNYGASSERLEQLKKELRYMTHENYKSYYEFQAALNGYITVYDGNVWTVLDENGEIVRGDYRYIGMLNGDGKGLYVNDIDTRLLDEREVTRARFNIDVEEAGYYSEVSDLLPVKIAGEWKYMKSSGEFLPGNYQIAGSFDNHEAVAFDGKQWVKLDVSGIKIELNDYDDIKLDLYKCHLQNGLILAKMNGKYHLYDAEFQQIGDFEADDIDICVSDRIAFAKEGKWGFVDKEGNVLLKPQFAKAKSFANGYAAVCDDHGYWGFINSDYELVIPYKYLDAHYFNSQEKCLVSITEGTVQLLEFKFD